MISNFEKLDEYRRIEESLSDNGAERLRDLLNSHFEYATFSHRWNETETTKEPTYGFIKDAQDDGQNIYYLKGGKDYEENMLKLRSFCYTAAKCGFRWAWSDTCCINKASPSEVQVSINSMYKWYSNSALTIVYLHDVPDVNSTMPRLSHTSHSVHDFVAKHPTGSQNPPILQYAKGKEFFDTQVEGSALEDLLKRCFQECDGELSVIPQWCVRCWTLQEMVAAQCLRFYCETWEALEPAFDPGPPDDNHIERFSDHRREDLWQYALSRSTGVDVKSLSNFTPGTTNVREKFHWASRREATQIEDMAYSLLGIFDVNMPVLYGEGMKAFVRLQEEIMKRSHDLSIFDFCGYASSVNSCLAHSPLCYTEKPLELEVKKKEAQMEIDAESQEDEESDDEGAKGDNEEYNSTPGSNGEKPVVSRRLLAWGSSAVDFFKKFIQADPPLGHSLINGAITVSVFEHKVNIEIIDHVTLRYKATAKGLTQAKFTTLEPLKLVDGPVYYLVRVYDRHVRRAIEIFVSAKSNKDNDAEDRGLDAKGLINIGKGLVDDAKGLVSQGKVQVKHNAQAELDRQEREKREREARGPGSREEHSAQAELDRRVKEKREREAKFLTLEHPFVVLLVAHDGDARCRVATESRIIVRYRNLKLDQAVERRTLV